jgi:hypothetical protein
MAKALHCSTCRSATAPLYSQPDRLGVYCLPCAMWLGAQMKALTLSAHTHEVALTRDGKTTLTVGCASACGRERGWT